ncbi:hypothetical protein [Shouchella lehensis]|uniref:Uncharacterized protein n=1 Tax=Shouchella lehensis TaxID=300825 RepID=A0A4Y7WGW1_9BACI|nr:hypothetical protein [Shouchella lehensis]MBG9782417.1 hypothetical protein [Shouchella lehensis]TES46843.1 hypothetical protein E2L03_19515 [Shouchella lehensis]
MNDFTEPLFGEVAMLPFEKRLFQTKEVRKLKFISQFGGASLISPLSHSLFEHTLGIWKLTAIFFPNHRLLRAGAILSQIEGIPFGSAIHSLFTINEKESMFKNTPFHSNEIHLILQEEKLDWGAVEEVARKSPFLHGTKENLGLIGLDRALRTLYMVGRLKQKPSHYVSHCCVNERGLHCSAEMAKEFVTVMMDTEQLLSCKEFGAIDAVISEAIKCDWAETGEECDTYSRLSDWEILCILKTSLSVRAQYLIHALLEQPDKFIVREGATGRGIPFSIYPEYRLPLISEDVEISFKNWTERLNTLEQTYEVIDFTSLAETI